jgi:hypothetical protein
MPVTAGTVLSYRSTQHACPGVYVYWDLAFNLQGLRSRNSILRMEVYDIEESNGSRLSKLSSSS